MLADVGGLLQHYTCRVVPIKRLGCPTVRSCRLTVRDHAGRPDRGGASAAQVPDAAAAAGLAAAEVSNAVPPAAPDAAAGAAADGTADLLRLNPGNTTVTNVVACPHRVHRTGMNLRGYSHGHHKRRSTFSPGKKMEGCSRRTVWGRSSSPPHHRGFGSCHITCWVMAT